MEQLALKLPLTADQEGPTPDRDLVSDLTPDLVPDLTAVPVPGASTIPCIPMCQDPTHDPTLSYAFT